MKKLKKNLVCCCEHLICISVFGLYEIILLRDIETIEKGRVVCSILEDDTTKIKRCTFWHYYPIIGDIVVKEERQKNPKGYKLVLGWVLALS